MKKMDMETKSVNQESRVTPRGTDKAEIIKVIHTYSLIGRGRGMEMEVNVHRLKTIMFDKGITQTKLAEKLGMDRGTLAIRLKNRGLTFQMKEIYIIIDLLELTDDEIKEVLFHRNENEENINKYII